jgi:flavin-dependent dehydrogenase
MPIVNPITFDAGDVAVTGNPEPGDGVSESLCPRRIILDQLLIEAAVEAGCEFREATPVDHLIWEEDRVVGITSRSRNGRELTERARLVIGADGVRSRIAEYVGATAYDEHPLLTGVFYTYWQGVERATWHATGTRHDYP